MELQAGTRNRELQKLLARTVLSKHLHQRTLTDLQHCFQQQPKATFQDNLATPEFLFRKFQGYQRNLFYPISDISPSSSFIESVYLKQRPKKKKLHNYKKSVKNKLEIDNKKTAGKLKIICRVNNKNLNNTWAKGKSNEKF